MDNPFVESKLRPGLKLAISDIGQSENKGMVLLLLRRFRIMLMLARYDALLFRTYAEIIDPDPKGPYVPSFSERGFEERNAPGQDLALMTKLSSLAECMKFTLHANLHELCSEWTTGIESLQPLPRKDLTEAEEQVRIRSTVSASNAINCNRKLIQFQFAGTLVHE
ncbi:hypothetical protein MBM_07384 [Drepanopeziza brunnea f. sp. 'multigermtubi' MB_m1]|uniref:Uncharacterized protein n=1 Tax=Marssonina brunnea f. sp. multigermtubi (strain MB_m1) TaxID=1072389 RepID=K1X1I9_MARBU|nr:uncharacterized protein MBM_07384 [Drepanopeziza brunnea f. sp. 'multigermtubi' MB_m1]EKD14663.1 hypothetical protein MBM_07384 [Drepanopeziza brunnea f. sp. 'multigermtubi' MB_m1]